MNGPVEMISKDSGTEITITFIMCLLYDLFSVIFFKKFIYFLLKDNCFTEFCCFLSNLNVNQP